MRILRNVLLIGSAVGIVGAVAYAADAPKTHVLTIPLPGGGVEQIRYTGDVAPRVTFRQAPEALAAFGPQIGDPFAMMQRIQAEMDREMAAMLQHPMAIPPMQGLSGAPLQAVTMGSAPAGAQSYSVVSRVSGGHQCTESVEITSEGPGRPPKVVRQTSGDCGGASAAPHAVAIPPGRRTSI
ncbi:MAG TPA: hypothetical protein VKT30_09910 [Caulobacteraceae bacterium]|nr:hypothetical protein [Caulobacteraceae bacterium]